MRALNKSEKLLLSIFGAAVLILLLLFGWQALQRGLSGQRQRAAALQGQLEELSQWLGQEDLWRERGAWLAGHPLPLWQREASESGLVQDLQNTLAGAGINIINQSLAGTEQFGDFFAVSVQLTLRATTEEIVRWLHATQQPGEFTQIQQLNLRADSEPPNLRVEVRLTRFFHTGGGGAAPVPDDEVLPTRPGLEEENPASAPESSTTPEETITESLEQPLPSTEEEREAATQPPAVPLTGPASEPEAVANAPAPAEARPTGTPASDVEVELPPAPVLPMDELDDNAPDDAFTETLPANEDPERIELLPVPRPTPALRLEGRENPVNSEPPLR